MTATDSADAVVIGAGHHGLVAANLLADAGWDVLVLEAAPEPGGAVRSGELTAPGFRHDLFSAFYPLAPVSPLAGLGLEDHGLRWRRAPLALAHPTAGGPTAVVAPTVEETADRLDLFAPGDGNAWRRLCEQWQRIGSRLLGAVLGPWPPLRSGAPLAAALLRHGGPSGLSRFGRFALLPVRTMADEVFAGAGGALVLAGNAAHADAPLEAPLSGLNGWLLAMLAQHGGFPVPAGGAGALTDALVRRLRAAGGELRCGEPVVRVDVAAGRATGVRTASGGSVTAQKAVLADVSAPALYRDLVGAERLAAATLEDLGRFSWDPATVKVDWALSAPIPWLDADCRRAGTVHLADSVQQLSDVAHDLVSGRTPARRFWIVGQQSMTDPSRMPPGAETAWAYTHVPRQMPDDRVTDDGAVEATVAAAEAEMEARAPGFRALVVGRHVWSPAGMEAADANLVGGAIGGGTAQLHQQLVWRPFPGRGGPSTPIEGLWLASASAHPGGGVHGACGANAARAALRHAARRRFTPW